MGVTPESQPCRLRNGSEDASDIRVQYIRAMIRKYVSTSLDLSLKAVHTGLESSIGGGLVVEGVGVGEISTQTGGLLMGRLVLALSTQGVTVAVYQLFAQRQWYDVRAIILAILSQSKFY